MISQALIFRMFGILVGVGLGLFSYSILKATKGATKGWLMFSIAGIMFFLWTTLMSIFTITDLYLGRVITSILLIPGTIVLMMSFARLAEDFEIDKPSWITAKNFLFINLGFIAIFTIINMFFTNNILLALLTAVLLDAAIANIMGMVTAIYLWKGTTKKIWISFAVFALLFAVGQLSCIYAGNCCDGGLEDEKSCESYELDYKNIYSIPCSSSLTKMSLIGYNFMTLGGLLLLVNFFYLWRKVA